MTESFFNSLVESMCKTEWFLLLASYMASHNPTKHDLVLFGGHGGKRKNRHYKRRQIGEGSTSTSTASGALEPVIPKLHPLDRLLAIFYWIVPDPVPGPLAHVHSKLAGLVQRGLLQKFSTSKGKKMRDGTTRYRCNLSPDQVSVVARLGNFDLAKYLLYRW